MGTVPCFNINASNTIRNFIQLNINSNHVNNMKKMRKMIRNKITISLLGLFFISSTAFMLPGKEKPATNPLFNEFNKPMDFSKLTAKDIGEAANTAISEARKDLEKIYAV